MSRDARAPATQRLDVVVALTAAFAWVSSASFWWDLDAPVTSPRLWAAWADPALLTRAPATYAQLAVVVASCVALVSGRARVRAELALLVSLHLTAVLEMSVRGTPMSSVAPLLIGLVLASRLAARAIAARAGSAVDAEVLGHEIACGAVGAAFFIAAIAKLETSGLAWCSPASQTLLVYERRESTIPLVGALREWLVAHPSIVGASAGASLLVESCGFAMLVPRLRIAWSSSALAMFVGLAIALGIVELTWMVLPSALALLAPKAPAGEPSSRRQPTPKRAS